MFRYAPLLFAVLLAFPAAARADRVLDHYDLDSLSALAKVVVKGELGDATDVKTRDGDCAVWDVTVLSTLKGDVKPKTVIRVAGIEEYQKGPGIEGVDKGFPRLAKGDIVYLFLVPKGAPMGYAKYALTNADWQVIESGTRLVLKNSVYSFGQYFPPTESNGSIPGFVAMTDKTFPKAPVHSVEAFEKQLQVSLQFVAELRRKLSANGLTDTERQAILKSRANVLKREHASTDYIAELIR